MQIGETYSQPNGLQVRITETGARLEIANLKEWRKFKTKAERRLGKIPDPPLSPAVQAKQERAKLNLSPSQFRSPPPESEARRPVG